MADITIPDASVEAAARARVAHSGWHWEDFDKVDQDAILAQERAALRAGLAAWPRSRQDYDLGEWSLILPLPQDQQP